MPRDLAGHLRVRRAAQRLFADRMGEFSTRERGIGSCADAEQLRKK